MQADEDEEDDEDDEGEEEEGGARGARSGASRALSPPSALPSEGSDIRLWRWRADRDAVLIGACPHAWLFERVAAVVHHGGAGAALAAL